MSQIEIDDDGRVSSIRQEQEIPNDNNNSASDDHKAGQKNVNKLDELHKRGSQVIRMNKILGTSPSNNNNTNVLSFFVSTCTHTRKKLLQSFFFE
jgi:hypothetical protein